MKTVVFLFLIGIVVILSACGTTSGSIVDAQAEIEKAKTVIDAKEQEGKDVSEARIKLEEAIATLEQAQNALDDGDAELSEELAEQAKQDAMWARGREIK